MHQLAQITTSVTTNIDNLNSIQNATLTPHFSNGSFPLNTGVMAGRTTSAPQTIDFTGNNFPVAVNTTASASPVLINASTTGNQASFSADLNIGGTAKTVNFANAFDITPGTQNALNLQISKCGAYLGPGETNWKEFMCQNLGATAGINPFSAEAGNYGLKVQFGRRITGVNGVYYVTQATDQSTPGYLANWNRTDAAADNAWNSGTEANPVKTANDPCPSGYRVPTSTEWQAVIANNNVERVGSWAGINYTTALYFRNSSNVRTLMFPTAGSRFDPDGTYVNYITGTYWSSSIATSNANAYYLTFSSSDVSVSNYFSRIYGFSVRCIAE
ncbi:TPA: hypothetical protein NEG48_003805 [Elizabethkingia anophelis]|nr:hypothetical protein [Elizabethkingia anophelis]